MRFDIYSKREKSPPDVFVYDKIPYALRVQVLHIVDRTIRSFTLQPLVYEDAADILREEYGVLRLPHLIDRRSNAAREVRQFFLKEERHIERVLDVVEVLLRLMRVKWAYEVSDPTINPATVSDAIGDVNRRFKEHGVGYEFVENCIIRKDSEYVHEEIVRPALVILQQEQFDGARDEFLQAHSDYRKGKNKEALNKCLNAFESTMRVICDKRRWSYPENPTASKLIDACMDNNIIPTFWKNHFSPLASLLKNGVPPGRNRLSAHGQGQQPQQVPDHIVRFTLHLTASTILFLGDADAIL